MNNLIDMHMHTIYSDGELSPDELVSKAIEKGIKTMAITDHDTTKGLRNLDKGKYKDIEIINGIELSIKVPKGQMHILGYDYDINDERINNRLEELRNNSYNQVVAIMGELVKQGIKFKAEDIQGIFNCFGNIGRPNIARVMVKYGIVSSNQEAFDKYLIEAYEKIRGSGKGILYDEALSLINNSGGIAVLAHPKSLKMDEKEFLITLRELIDKGLRGIEVYHSTHSKEDIEYFERIAKEYNLLVSGGSDYHGPFVKPDIEVGTGRNNNLHIKQLSLVDELHNRHS